MTGLAFVRKSRGTGQHVVVVAAKFCRWVVSFAALVRAIASMPDVRLW